MLKQGSIKLHKLKTLPLIREPSSKRYRYNGGSNKFTIRNVHVSQKHLVGRIVGVAQDEPGLCSTSGGGSCGQVTGWCLAKAGSLTCEPWDWYIYEVHVSRVLREVWSCVLVRDQGEYYTDQKTNWRGHFRVEWLGSSILGSSCSDFLRGCSQCAGSCPTSYDIL